MTIQIIAIIILAAIVCFYLGVTYRKLYAERLIKGAEAESKRILEEANKKSETVFKEEMIKTKDEIFKMKHDLDVETKQRRGELKQFESRLMQKEDNIENKIKSIESKEAIVAEKYEEVEKIKSDCNNIVAEQIKELERVAKLSSEDAKKILLEKVQNEVKYEMVKKMREIEEKAKDEADKKAKDIVVSAIQRCAVEHTAESTVTVVSIPSDDMKGRIIGREGRNIKTIETLTGIDLIIDDTPEAVILSGFDPVRREIARLTLEKLIVDGRIHPTKIEEMFEKSTNEVEKIIKDEGERALFETGITNLHPDLIKLLGKMKYRTSYGQSVLNHSIEVSLLSGLLATELGEDPIVAKRAGLLHDIGKSVDHEIEGTHVEIGSNILKKYKESPVVINSLESHHGDVVANSVIAVIVQSADAISGSRPGARRDTLEIYMKRLKKLEEISNSFEGVDKAFAVQAGRELRIIVKSEKIDDADMYILARNIVKRIENEVEYPGNVKVNVIRETRAIEYAK